MTRRPKDPARIPAAWLAKSTAERAAAIKAFRRPRGKEARSFAFEAYGDPLLRDVLNAIYYFKCAYCETFYGASQPVAIEHFRPKGMVVEGKMKITPGYYWLAAEWSNLFPSCTDCNSPRKQQLADGTKVLRGKGNQFPLVDSRRRATQPNEERRESPLLLNPAEDEPDEHLEFLVEATNVGGVRPRLREGAASPMGVASIEVYALDRPLLHQNRAWFGKRVLFQASNTENALLAHLQRPHDAKLRSEYERQLEELGSYLAPDAQYVGLARQIVKARFPALATG